MNRLSLRLACLILVAATAPGCDPNGSSPLDMDSTGNPPQGTTTGSIRGTVLGAGSPLRGALVVLNGPVITRSMTTEMDGAFTFADLAPGVYIATASLSGVACGATTADMKGGETLTTSIVCTLPQLGTASITGTVTAGEAPLDGGRVTLTGLPFTGALEERAVVADTAGRFTFSGLTRGTYSLGAEATGFTCLSRGVDIQDGQTATANITCAEDSGGSGGEPPGPPTMADAGKIAFERGGRIMILDLDGDYVLNFIDGRAPSWSADGRKLVFQRRACLDRSLPPGSDCDDVWRVNADGSGLAPITSYNWVMDYDPVWSPDGTRVAFVRFVHGPDQSYIVVTDVDPPSALWSETVLSSWWPYSRPTWSPDGANIAFTCSGSAPPWELDLCVVQSNSSGTYSDFASGNFSRGLIKITNDTWTNSDPAWSPDGTRIAFTTNRNAPDGRSYIALVNPNGGGFTRLVPGSRPAWSPDGTRIVFVGEADAPGLYVVNVDGSGLVQITDDPADTAPSWAR